MLSLRVMAMKIGKETTMTQIMVTMSNAGKSFDRRIAKIKTTTDNCER